MELGKILCMNILQNYVFEQSTKSHTGTASPRKKILVTPKSFSGSTTHTNDAIKNAQPLQLFQNFGVVSFLQLCPN